MRNYNQFVPTPTVGGFNNDNTAGVKNMLAELSEFTQASANLDSVNNIKEVLLNNNLLEGYSDIATGDYHQYAGQNAFCESLHRLNAEKLEQKIQNSAETLLSEAGSGTLNPITGLTMPLLKLHWIENVMKDFFHTEVAPTFVINRQIEKVYLQDGEGKKIYIPEAFNEMTSETRKELLAIGDRKLSDELIPVGEVFDLIEKSGGSVRTRDEVSRNFRISEVHFSIPESRGTEEKQTREAKTGSVKVSIKPDAANNNFSEMVKFTDDAGVAHVDMLFGKLDYSTGALHLGSSAGLITGVKVTGTLSSENNLTSASVAWETENIQFEIPSGKHLSTGLTEERMKREKVVYDIDVQAKTVTNMSMVLNQLKDSEQLDYLDESREMIKAAGDRLHIETTFDCTPSGQYALTPVEYRSIMLKEKIEKVAERMKKVLRNPNVFFAIIGNSEDVRLLKDINWEMTQGTSIVGGCAMTYSFGLMSGNHNFLVLSSDKMTRGELRMIVRPLTQDQISYIHFDYDFIISNNYRDPNNPNVPAVMTTQSYLTDEVTPIQATIKIVNNDL